VQRQRGVTDDWKSAAPGGPILGKRRHHHKPIRPQRLPNLLHVDRAFGLLREEVEDRPIVPDIEGARWKASNEHVRFQPRHT
jgi:hypothetical protein